MQQQLQRWLAPLLCADLSAAESPLQPSAASPAYRPCQRAGCQSCPAWRSQSWRWSTPNACCSDSVSELQCCPCPAQARQRSTLVACYGENYTSGAMFFQARLMTLHISCLSGGSMRGSSLIRSSTMLVGSKSMAASDNMRLGSDNSRCCHTHCTSNSSSSSSCNAVYLKDVSSNGSNATALTHCYALPMVAAMAAKPATTAAMLLLETEAMAAAAAAACYLQVA